ncbi:hypothetical protein [Paenibacillus sp. BIC5C1]|uniref:hypothetical protein n=1 Tax=Paenibacillus sp. BIC5C1 TaxID=3078263 RepID=UPI0028EC3C57|nr:hypothetical protein [Paenibacillus sp. BIC5C1]
MKQIKVRCTDSFEEFNLGNGRLVCAVNYGEELVADLHKESEEYYSTDSQGREVYVGCLDMNGTLELDDCFELVEEGADTE